MKTKFDDNVATDIPVTKSSAEPELPWKLSDSEMGRIESTDENLKANVNSPPLQARAIFVVLLVVAIFFMVLNSIANVIIDNNEMQIRMLKKDREVSSIKTTLEKTSTENAALSDEAVRLEKRVTDLSAQKELYTAVIETLTKKTDDTQAN